MADYKADPRLKFCFGLWTVGNPGRDPFGEPVREKISPVQICDMLGEVGAYGVSFHDNDLIPIDATASERDQIVKDFKAAVKNNNLVVPMATTNLFTDPVFKDGAFTSNNAKIRAYAIQKTMRGMDLGAEMGAKMYVFWGGREGVESDATKCPVEAVKRFREAINFLCDYSIDKKYGYKFAFEAKPNEPRGHMYFAVTGSLSGVHPDAGPSRDVRRQSRGRSRAHGRAQLRAPGGGRALKPASCSTSISTTRSSADTTRTSASGRPTSSTRFSW